MLIDDYRAGPTAAADKILGATRRRCRVPCTLNMTPDVATKERPLAIVILKTKESKAAAKGHWRKVETEFESRCRRLSEAMAGSVEQDMVYMNLPAEHRRQIQST